MNGLEKRYLHNLLLFFFFPAYSPGKMSLNRAAFHTQLSALKHHLSFCCVPGSLCLHSQLFHVRPLGSPVCFPCCISCQSICTLCLWLWNPWGKYNMNHFLPKFSGYSCIYYILVAINKGQSQRASKLHPDFPLSLLSALVTGFGLEGGDGSPNLFPTYLGLKLF